MKRIIHFKGVAQQIGRKTAQFHQTLEKIFEKRTKERIDSFEIEVVRCRNDIAEKKKQLEA